uniref:thiamine biosynthesis protein S n=1 Tax=Haslea karadagensis TaxID=1146996 RepID=UPI00220FCA18|nr:thiamine biosynthesis protein S [Haslea karadagensis]UXN44892.1 thiamine biosynthesis protein S [Haslea karadagensis]UXN45153.1 thiamine biosynthesis protein S [Haslea karadagensis]
MVESQPTALTTWPHPPAYLDFYCIIYYNLTSSLFIKKYLITIMSQVIQFYLNGENYYIKTNLSISKLIKYFNYNKSLLVLEYNSLICHKKNWDKIFVQNNDRIEIVTIVGGG